MFNTKKPHSSHENPPPAAATAAVRASSPPDSRSDNLSFLDSARGVAILCVFAYHVIYQAFARDQLAWHGWVRNFDAPASFFALYPLTWGWCGVAIFFVISGFCIHLSYARAQQPSIADFYVRRCFRIYPPYLLSLLFFAFLFPFTRLSLHSHAGAGQFFSHLFLVHNLDARTKHGIVVAWWSIAVEFQLYLLYPLLLAAARRIGWRHLLLCTAVIELGLRVLADIYSLKTHNLIPTMIGTSPLYYLFSWTVGAAQADAYLNGKPSPFAGTPVSLWVVLLIAADFVKPLHPFSFTFAALATAAVIARWLSAGNAACVPVPAPLRDAFTAHLQFIGRCSYGIYLIHHPIVEAWPRLVRLLLPAAPAHPLFMYACCLASWSVILPLSYGIYRFVELPSISLGKRAAQRLRRMRAHAGTAGASA